MQVSAYYKNVENPPVELCEKFVEKLNESPHKILDAMQGKEGNEWSRKIKEFGEAQKESFKKAMKKEYKDKEEKKKIQGKSDEL